MPLLLDTHTFIWFDEGNPRLSAQARALIERPDAVRFVSVVSFWEMAIKASMGRLAFRAPVEVLMRDALAPNSLLLLPTAPAHLAAVPFHHRDPFDRMLIAQARADGLTLVSRDEPLNLYNVPRAG